MLQRLHNSAPLHFYGLDPRVKPEGDEGALAPNKTARLSAGRSLLSRSPITEPAQVPELAQGPVRVPEQARAPGQAPERVLVPEPALQAPEPACWLPAAQPGHARRRFCQRHNTQQWPG